MPVWIHLKDDKRFAFAGSGIRGDAEGDTLYTFTIITTMPNALLRPIHYYLMPAVFDKLLAKYGSARCLGLAMRPR